jgi:hypothetical protein
MVRRQEAIYFTAQRETEREGFEPPLTLPPKRISSAPHSTTLPSLQEWVLCHSTGIDLRLATRFRFQYFLKRFAIA